MTDEPDYTLVVDSANWDGQWTMCFRCWASIKSAELPGVVFHRAPLAQSMARLGICLVCIQPFINELYHAVTPDATDRKD